jgi:glycosyltransferase involved in cell wall biosynthesis
MRDTNDLVSIIIPCYNQGEFLGEAIKSLLNQSHQHWECLIINDGSTDASENFAKQWQVRESRIMYIYQDNLGVSAARNIGLKHANGDFIQFLDADDQLERHKIQSGLNIFSDNPTAQIVVSGAKYFLNNEPNKFRNNIFDDAPWMDELWKNEIPLIKRFLEKNLTPINSPLIKRNVFKAVGNFDESMNACEDWDFWLRCAIFKINYLYRATLNADALIRIHVKSANQNRKKMFIGECELSIKAAKQLTDPKYLRYNYELGVKRLAALDADLNSRDLVRLAYVSSYFRGRKNWIKKCWAMAFCYELMRESQSQYSEPAHQCILKHGIARFGRMPFFLMTIISRIYIYSGSYRDDYEWWRWNWVRYLPIRSFWSCK